MPRPLPLLLIALTLPAVGCGTTLSAEQEKVYDKLLEDRDNERSWIETVGTERAQLRAKVAALETKKGAAAPGALTCGAWGGGKLRIGTAPVGPRKGKAVELAGGPAKSIAGGRCSTGGARVAP